MAIPHFHVRQWAAVVATFVVLPASATAQRYQLRIAPVPGDTLRMQLEQQTEVRGEERPESPARSMKARLSIYSHAIVTGRANGATTLVAHTDSVVMDSDDEHARNLEEQARRLAGAEPVWLRLAADGTVRLLDDAGNLASDVSGSVSLIPAALPPGALAIGETWMRSMPVPVGPSADVGTVRATFRLDSVSAGGRIAYISVRGDLARGAMPAAGPRGTMMKVAGSVAGHLNLDRVRGWIADSRFVVTMHSIVEPPASSGISPIRFRTVVTQRMRLRDRTPASARARQRAPEQRERP